MASAGANWADAVRSILSPAAVVPVTTTRMPSSWARNVSSAGSTDSSAILGLSLAPDCAARVVQHTTNINATVQVQLVLRMCIYLAACVALLSEITSFAVTGAILYTV